MDGQTAQGSSSPRTWALQPHRADKGARSLHLGVGNAPSHPTALMSITSSAKRGTWDGMNWLNQPSGDIFPFGVEAISRPHSIF